MIGMTSVTFRKMTAQQIIDLVAQSALEGIEWGGDIHVPPGDLQTADLVRTQTEKAGLAVLSYGSYYRLGCDQDFAPVLDSAAALGAPVIRVWAGSVGSQEADEQTYAALARELTDICHMAAEKNIRVALEYHRNTLTDTGQSAAKLLNMAQNALCYWQPNPDISLQDHLNEINLIAPYQSNVHVFAWEPGNVAHPLDYAADAWQQYFAALRQHSQTFHAIMEFVKDSDPQIFLRDAGTLRGLYYGDEGAGDGGA